MDYKNGYLAVSAAGHDKNEMYVIIQADQQYVYLADGKYKTIEKPKKKKKKHIQLINYIDPDIEKKFANSQLLINEDIKRAIKKYISNM